MTYAFYGGPPNPQTVENNHTDTGIFFLPKKYREMYGFESVKTCFNCQNYLNAKGKCERFKFMPGVKDLIFAHPAMVCNFWGLSANMPRDTAQQQEWAKHVYERDNYTCQHCGAKGIEPSQSFIEQEGRTITIFDPGLKLYAHHIKPYALFPKLAYDIDNGITLCHKCHVKAHREYGGYALHKLPEEERTK